MKALFAALVLISSLTAFAGDKYICIQTNSDTYSPAKVILTQVGEGLVVEGKTTPFTLEIYTDYTTKPSVKEVVFVSIEDVMFEFKNKSKKIEGIIFMDEMNEASVTVGKKKIQLNCN